MIVSVAASARDAVQEIVKPFEQETGVVVRINAGSSSALASQILAGAPADLFLSASPEWTEALREKNLVARSCDLLSNDLVLVTPRGNPAGVHSPQDLLAQPVRKVALAGEHVPAGKYADQVLAALKLDEGLSQKIVRGSDVRVTLSYVERGEAEAGIVYASDARLSTSVETVYRVPPGLHDPIRYPLVLVEQGRSNPAASRLYDYLQSDEARAVFVGYGFSAPSSACVPSQPHLQPGS